MRLAVVLTKRLPHSEIFKNSNGALAMEELASDLTTFHPLSLVSLWLCWKGQGCLSFVSSPGSPRSKVTEVH